MIFREEIQESTNPSKTVANFIEFFNREDKDALNDIFDSPCVLIFGERTNVHMSYGDAVDFDSLRKTGWSYSKINSLDIIHEDEEISVVKFNFSRLNDIDVVISSIDATHVLVFKENMWKIKTVFVSEELSLG